MKTILTVIKKEFVDTLRDRRTLISAIVLPAIAIPLLVLGVSKLQGSLMQQEESKQLKVALLHAPEELKETFSKESFELFGSISVEDGKKAVARDSLDAVIAFGPDFLSNIDQMQSGSIQLYYKSTNPLVHRRVMEKLNAYRAMLVDQRIKALNISPTVLSPVSISETDVASSKEQVSQTVGGFLPYIFILFSFLGCMYPAIDLITGEKERGTIETLLTVPAPRLHILIGKMITIALIGLSAALMTIVGMFAGLSFISDINQDLQNTINDILNFRFIIMLFAMLLPLSLFFSGMLSAIVVRTKSFKEAQSYATPVSFMIIIPAGIAMMPGITLNWQTVWVPILNVALATKEIMAGTIVPEQFMVIILYLTVLALAAAFGSIRQFSTEDAILK